MGRLVRPISDEEYEKLPEWEKWISRNGNWLIPLVIVVASLIIFFGMRWFK